MPPLLPEAIGKYTIERFIESGGMGDVYLARDPALDRPVAIKFLREGFDNQEMRERFEREARAAGRLSHPNIVTIYEFGIFESRPFIAMEFVRGEPLSKLVRRRESISIVRKLEMMEGLCSGLAHAHKTGLVHRDIKPANLMVDLDGGAPLKILDFGIVRMAGSGLTSHGVLVGTINYMSPEQITGRGTIDHRSDVFAVGAVLHEIFTYQRAFPGEMTDVLYKIVHAQPESAATLAPGLDPGIVRAIDQCLEKTPERRYQDLGQLRRDLARIRQRLEIDEQDAYGHTALTLRQPKDRSGSHRIPGSGAPASGTPPSGAPASGMPASGLPAAGTASPPSAPSGPSGRSGPPSGPSVPSPAPGSDRARRAAEAAAALERAQRAAEEARLELEREAEEQARLEAERLERERQEAERRERERLARERAEAEQARLAREKEERLRAEQARAEQARLEAARQEQARQEQLRLDKARAEEAERARLERERQEQIRLEEARLAREQAERQRAEAQRKAEAEARRLAEERRQQRARDLAFAQKEVAAGRFAEAAQRLQPWTAEAAGDAAFASVLQQAQAGVARLEAERREQEALARQLDAAKEQIVRQDFAGAGTLVQAILAAHPNHPAAQTLEKEIARGVEFRARAAAAVERARSLFDARPGEAMELLERFTPAHGLVDGALAELRERHAVLERERLRREQQARRQQQIDAVKARAGELARNRAVQGGVAAALLLVVVIASWSSIFPPRPVDPGAGVPGTATPSTSTPPTGSADPGAVDRGAVTTPIDTPTTRSVDPGPAATPANGRDSRVAVPTTTYPPTPAPSRTATAATPVQGAAGQPNGSPRNGGAIAVPPAGSGSPAGAATPPDPNPPANARTEPRPDPTPEPPRDTVKETVPPPAPDLADIARREIRQWIATYQQAFASLDADRVKAMNPASNLRPAQYNSASVSFSNVDIQPHENGQSAVLHAVVQYQYGFKRGVAPPPPARPIAWPMRKTANGWVANP